MRKKMQTINSSNKPFSALHAAADSRAAVSTASLESSSKCNNSFPGDINFSSISNNNHIEQSGYYLAQTTSASNDSGFDDPLLKNNTKRPSAPPKPPRISNSFHAPASAVSATNALYDELPPPLPARLLSSFCRSSSTSLPCRPAPPVPYHSAVDGDTHATTPARAERSTSARDDDNNLSPQHAQLKQSTTHAVHHATGKSSPTIHHQPSIISNTPSTPPPPFAVESLQTISSGASPVMETSAPPKYHHRSTSELSRSSLSSSLVISPTPPVPKPRTSTGTTRNVSSINNKPVVPVRRRELRKAVVSVSDDEHGYIELGTLDNDAATDNAIAMTSPCRNDEPNALHQQHSNNKLLSFSSPPAAGVGGRDNDADDNANAHNNHNYTRVDERCAAAISSPVFSQHHKTSETTNNIDADDVSSLLYVQPVIMSHSSSSSEIDNKIVDTPVLLRSEQKALKKPSCDDNNNVPVYDLRYVIKHQAESAAAAAEVAEVAVVERLKHDGKGKIPTTPDLIDLRASAYYEQPIFGFCNPNHSVAGADCETPTAKTRNNKIDSHHYEFDDDFWRVFGGEFRPENSLSTAVTAANETRRLVSIGIKKRSATDCTTKQQQNHHSPLTKSMSMCDNLSDLVKSCSTSSSSGGGGGGTSSVMSSMRDRCTSGIGEDVQEEEQEEDHYNVITSFDADFDDDDDGEDVDESDGAIVAVDEHLINVDADVPPQLPPRPRGNDGVPAAVAVVSGTAAHADDLVLPTITPAAQQQQATLFGRLRSKLSGKISVSENTAAAVAAANHDESAAEIIITRRQRRPLSAYRGPSATAPDLGALRAKEASAGGGTLTNATESVDAGGCLFSGYVMQAGSASLTRDLRRRWCVVRDGKLMLFTDAKARKPRTSISQQEFFDLFFRTVTRNSLQVYCIEIATSTEKQHRALYLTSPDEILIRKLFNTLIGVYLPELLVAGDDAVNCSTLDAVGRLYYKTGITSSWQVGCFGIAGRVLSLFTPGDDVPAREEFDLRKTLSVRALTLQAAASAELIMCPDAEQCAPFAIDLYGGRVLFIQSGLKRQTQAWFKLIQQRARSSGPALEDQPLTAHNVPVVVQKCVDFIFARGLKTEGIYRKQATQSRVIRLLELFKNSDSNFHLTCEYTELDVASALKRWLRSLPEPVLPYELHQPLIQSAQLAANNNDDADDADVSANDDNETELSKIKIELYKKILASLPVVNYMTLKTILQHLFLVAQFSQWNQMSIGNLALVFGPTLMGSGGGGASTPPSGSNNITNNSSFEACARDADISVFGAFESATHVVRDLLRNFCVLFDADAAELTRSQIVLKNVLQKVETSNIKSAPTTSSPLLQPVYFNGDRESGECRQCHLNYKLTAEDLCRQFTNSLTQPNNNNTNNSRPSHFAEELNGNFGGNNSAANNKKVASWWNNVSPVCLMEYACNGDLKRPLNAKEKVLQTVLRWADWAQSGVCKYDANFLRVVEHCNIVERIQTMLNEEQRAYLFAEAFVSRGHTFAGTSSTGASNAVAAADAAAEQQQQPFVRCSVEISSHGQLSVWKDNKQLNKPVKTWPLSSLLWFVGADSGRRHAPPTAHVVTLVEDNISSSSAVALTKQQQAHLAVVAVAAASAAPVENVRKQNNFFNALRRRGKSDVAADAAGDVNTNIKATSATVSSSTAATCTANGVCLAFDNDNGLYRFLSVLYFHSQNSTTTS